MQAHKPYTPLTPTELVPDSVLRELAQDTPERGSGS